ncbi:2,3-bisphosphoglycerate-independent phosphoglycerate mutase [uncultured archaeon]|nr:2,3-bisphosphoglycerate-independent phosphoglycerate mutase [uncultured archaeon]
MQHLTKKVTILIILLLTLNPALGASEITLNDIERPESAILLIVDGLGASYYYPELTPFALDGSELSRAGTQNLAFGTRIINISTPYPDTGIAHSVIVTGFSEANEEIVGYPDATIYDITRQHGFFNIAVMEKGDFMNMREEQDIILYAENNSIDDPKISVQSKNPPPGVLELMDDWKEKLPEYLDGKSGVGKYSAYNKWGIDAANAVAVYMIEEHPTSKFFLTVNVGAIDSGGHNMGDDDYIRLVEDLDRDIYSLYETAKENDMAFFFTADHGMAFAKKNARRGGHVSEKYVSMKESLRIPFVMISQNAVPGLISGGYGEEDIAPTILSVLDLPNHLQYADGTSIHVKKYASIFVKADSEYKVSLWDGGTKLSEQSASELIFAGLPLNASYTVKASGAGGTFEEKVSLDSDRQFRFDNKTGLNQKQMAAGILIIIVNIAGLAIIRRIK